MSRPEFHAKLVLEASVSPSEDPIKVAGAVGVIAGVTAEMVELGSRSARLQTSDPKTLLRIRDKLRDRHIRSAARRQLLINRTGNSTSLMFNRQAAAAGVIALCGSPEESPLGPIYAAIESDRLDEVIDWLATYERG